MHVLTPTPVPAGAERGWLGDRTTSWVVGILVAVVFGRLLDEFFVPGLGISFGQLVLVGALGVLGARWATGRQVGAWRGGFVIIAAYWVLGLVSLLHASDVATATDELADVLQNSLVFFAILIGVDSASRLRVAIWGFVGAAGILAALNLYQLATGTFQNDYWGLATAVLDPVENRFDIRISGPGLGPNGLAHVLTFCIPLAVNRFESERSRSLRLLALSITILLVIGTVFTYSRNGFLTMLLIGFLTAMYRRVPLRRIAAVGVIGTIALVSLAPGQYAERLGTLTKLGSAPATTESRSVGRASEYLAGVQMYLEHPVLGVGLGNYPSRYLEYSERIGLDTRREDRAPHSLYVQFAAELGAAGLAWLAATIVVTLVGLRRARQLLSAEPDAQRLVAAVEIAFIAFLAFSVFRHIALHRYFLMPLALALATPNAVLVGRIAAGTSLDEDGRRRPPLRFSAWSGIAVLLVGVSAIMLLVTLLS